MIRSIVALLLLVAVLGGAGVVSADSSDNAKACPENGNPSVGLVVSTGASDGQSLNAIPGVNTAFENVGCDTRLDE